jgi:hypothetical protein
MTPLPATQALDAFFLDARCRLLDVAAVLDRIDRGSGDVSTDPRVSRIRAAVAVLAAAGPGRAEKIQQVFSLGYDPDWPKPTPR